MRLLSNLTMNIGLRHEFTDGWDNKNGCSNFVYGSDGVYQTEPSVGESCFLVNNAKWLFGPRAALAWDPTGRGTTAVHAGFGVHYGMLDDLGFFVGNNTPFNTRYALSGITFPFRITPTSTLPASSIAPQGVQPDMDTPATVAWSLRMDRQLGAKAAVSVAYIGSHGYHGITNADYNIVRSTTLADGRKFFPQGGPRMNPSLGDGRTAVSLSDSTYHALEIDLTRRLGQGLSFRGNYTLSESRDISSAAITADAGSGGSQNLLDPYDPGRDWGPSAFDVRHRVSVNVSYELPFGPGRRFLAADSGALAHVVRDWQVNTIVTVQSGFPFTPLLGFNQSRNGDTRFPDRPDWKEGADRANVILGTPERWFDPTVFSLPLAGTYGNVGRNVLTGPGLATVALSVFKDIDLPGRAMLQFRAEAFNLLNRTNFATPTNLVLNTDGSVRATAGSHHADLNDVAADSVRGQGHLVARSSVRLSGSGEIMKRKLLAAIGLCAVSALVTVQRASAQADPPIVIDGATLIDVVSGTTVADAVVVILGNRITAAGARGSVTLPAGARIIPAKGKFVLPGLTDAHVHFRDWMPELFLAAGVTSIVDVSNPAEWTFALREGVEDGNIRGPRIFTTGGLINGPTAAKGHHIQVQTPAAAAEAAMVLADRKADAIKVYTHMTADQIRAAADVAHRHNIPVIGHIGISAREAVLAGLDVIAHGTGIAVAVMSDPIKKAAAIKEGIPELLGAQHANMDPATYADFIKLLVDREVYIEPDLVTIAKGIHPRSAEFQEEWRTILSNPALSYIPGDHLLRWQTLLGFESDDAARIKVLQEGYGNLRAFLQVYVKAGGRLLAATDTQHYVPAGITLVQEIELFVQELGMTPLEALRTATLNAGLFLRRGDVGSIKAGSLADLIIVGDDPLKSVSNLRKVAAVIVNGRVMDTGFHATYRIPIARPAEETAGGYPRPNLAGIAPVVAVETMPSETAPSR